MTSRSRFILAAAFSGFTLLLPVNAAAQRGQTSALAGIVRDPSDAVMPGAAVTVSSPQLIGGPATATTGRDGSYRFIELLPGVYEIRVESPGFKVTVCRDVELAPGAAVTIDWTLAIATAEQEVDVTSAAPMIDVRTAAVPARLNASLLRHLPVTRSVLGLVNLMPGIVADVPLGASAQSFAVRFDGTPGSDPGIGWTSVLPVHDSIEELQVVAGGAGAEYGEFTGVQANVVVRSGGDRLSGLGEYRTRRPKWVGDNSDKLSANLRRNFRLPEIVSDWDLNGSVGAPLVRGRAWLYAAYQQQNEDTRGIVWLDRPRLPNDPVTRIDEHRGIAKITAAPWPHVRLEGFYQHNRSAGAATNASPFVEPEALIATRERQHVWNARMMWTLGPRTLVHLMHGGHVDDYHDGPTAPMTIDGPAPHYDLATNVQSGNAVWFDDFHSRPVTTAGSLTRLLDDRLGSHEIKAGFEHQFATSDDLYGYPGGAFYQDRNGQPDSAEFWPPPRSRRSQHRLAMYAQDRWQIASRLTLEPGVRVALSRGRVHQVGHVLSMSTISPRLGVAWDMTRSHRTVVRAHAGRYHDPMFSTLYGFMDPLGATVQSFAAPAGNGEFRITSSVGGIENRGIDKDLSQSHVDAYLLGIEHELTSDLSVKAQYLQRNFGNFLSYIDPAPAYDLVTRPDPGLDNRLNTADDGAPIQVFNRRPGSSAFRLLTNVDAAYRRYQAFQLIGTKRYAHNWEMKASYTWSRARGNVSNLANTNIASNGMGPNGPFANPNVAINMSGIPFNDFPHQVTVLGTGRFPWWGGFTVGAVYRYYTGRAYGRTIRVSGLTQGAETIRVERIGTYRVPAYNQLDLRFEKTWRPDAGRSLGVFADILNINNQGTSKSVKEESGANYLPNGWTLPRSVRAGVRLIF